MKRKAIIIAAMLCVTVAGVAGPLYKNSKAPIDARVEDLLSRMTLDEKCMQLQNRQVGHVGSIADNL